MTLTSRIVLLGEPDQAASALYERALHAAFDVIATPDEDGVLHMLHTRPIAALVLEPIILATNRWQQLAAISQICAEREIPLVLCSTLDERRRGLELGAAIYLVKPTLPSTLLDTLRQVIGPERN